MRVVVLVDDLLKDISKKIDSRDWKEGKSADYIEGFTDALRFILDNLPKKW